jgi:hypothetical protein
VSPWPALLCGVVTGASFYVYGAAFAVPILITAVLVGSWLCMPRPRFAARHLVLYAASLLATLAPLAITYRSPDALATSHFGERIVRGDVVSQALDHFATALSAYVLHGDPVARVNPQRLAHVDPLGLVLAIVGCVWWLAPRRRRWGVVVVGGFLLMHLPTALAMEGAINAARTIAAAPFLYILVASGAWAIGAFLRRRFSAKVGVAVAGALLAVMIGINLRRYFVLYPPGLPYRNTPIARAITDYVDMLPASTRVHLVGSTWTEGMPEPKSIAYTMRHPESFREESAAVDCDWLARVTPPAVLIWSHHETLPNQSLARCGSRLTPQLFSSVNGQPLFHAAAVGALTQHPMTANDERPSIETTEAWQPPNLQRATILLGDQPVEFLHQPIDMGHPRDVVDGDTATLMRGDDLDPFQFELRYAEPTRITGYRLWIGYIPDFTIELTIQGADGEVTRLARREQPSPGMPEIDLTLPQGPVMATSARFVFDDARSHPLEGWHVHLFELEQR